MYNVHVCALLKDKSANRQKRGEKEKEREEALTTSSFPCGSRQYRDRKRGRGQSQDWARVYSSAGRLREL